MLKLNVEEALERLLAYPHCVLNNAELAKIFGISRAAVTQRGNRGSLPLIDFYLGKRAFWERETVRLWLLNKDG